RWPVEKERLRRLRHSGAARREPVDGPEVVDLASGVPAARPGEVEDAAIVDGNRGRGRQSPRGPLRGVESLTSDVNLHCEAGRQEDLPSCGSRTHEKDEQ